MVENVLWRPNRERGRGKIKCERNGFFYLGILLISIVLTLPFYHGNFHNGNDIAFHLARLVSTASSINDGQLIPQFDPQALEGFGYAWNEFYGPLPTYFVYILHLILQSWAFSLAVFYTLILFVSGILMYRLVNFLTDSKTSQAWPGFLAAVILLFSNSTYINVYYYANPGQPLAICSAILLIFGISKLFRKISFSAILMIALGAAGLPLSHTITTICVAPFVFLYVIFRLIGHKGSKRITVFAVGLLSVLLAVGLSAFFLLPLRENLTSGIYNVSNAGFSKTFGWNDIRYFGGSWETVLQPSFQYYNFPSIISVGLVLIIFGACLVNIFRKKQLSKALIFSIFSLIIVAMNLPIFPWRFLSFFSIIQGSVRFSAIFGIFAALAISLFLGENIKFFTFRRSLLVVVVLTLLFGAEFTNRVKFGSSPLFAKAPQQNINLYAYNPDSIAIGEYLPKKVGTHQQTYQNTVKHFSVDHNPYGMRDQAYQYLRSRSKKPEILRGQLIVTNYKVRGSHENFRVTASSDSAAAQVELPETYYPGFKAMAKTKTGKILKLSTQLSKNGLLAINFPKHFKGELTVKTYFGMSPATRLGGNITLFTVVLLIVLSVFLLIRRLMLRK